VASSTVAICTKLDPRIFRDLAIDTSMSCFQEERCVSSNGGTTIPSSDPTMSERPTPSVEMFLVIDAAIGNSG
jgi:hypothetical protein